MIYYTQCYSLARVLVRGDRKNKPRETTSDDKEIVCRRIFVSALLECVLMPLWFLDIFKSMISNDTYYFSYKYEIGMAWCSVFQQTWHMKYVWRASTNTMSECVVLCTCPPSFHGPTYPAHI